MRSMTVTALTAAEISYKDMQVDHFKPQRAWNTEDAGTDDISNLMPACRMCNHYKRANSLETFRKYIAEIPANFARITSTRLESSMATSLRTRNR